MFLITVKNLNIILVVYLVKKLIEILHLFLSFEVYVFINKDVQII